MHLSRCDISIEADEQRSGVERYSLVSPSSRRRGQRCLRLLDCAAVCQWARIRIKPHLRSDNSDTVNHSCNREMIEILEIGLQDRGADSQCSRFVGQHILCGRNGLYEDMHDAKVK